MSAVALMKNQAHKQKIAVTYPNNPPIIIQQSSVVESPPVSPSTDITDPLKQEKTEEVEILQSSVVESPPVSPSTDITDPLKQEN